MAPVVLLVTSVAIWETWRCGFRQRAAVMAVSLVLLAVRASGPILAVTVACSHRLAKFLDQTQKA